MITFWASPWGGSRYHQTWACTGLNSTGMAMLSTNSEAAVQVNLREIRRRGLQPCLVCKPPPMLRVVEAGA